MRDFVLGQMPVIQRLAEETMLQYAEQWDPDVDRDIFGGELVTRTKTDAYPCGLKIILVSERHNFTGVDQTVDAIIRIPYSKIAAVQNNSQLRILYDGAQHWYDLVGPVRPGIGCGVVEATKVQNNDAA
jgi:hypothetical protein